MRTGAKLGLALGLAVVAAVAAIVAFAVRWQAGAGLPARGATVWAFDPAAAVALDAQGAEGTLRLRRTGEGWEGAPPGSAGHVPALLDVLAALRNRVELAAPGKGNLAWYGLDHPRLQLTLTGPGGQLQRLALGQTNGADGTVFALGPRGEVLVLPAEAGAELEAHLAALRAGQPGGGPPGPNGG
ncbi:MAG: hypothetical protein QM767_26535 [Anaeromyxobacter sp.]